jgi:hypothetical protein
VEDLFTSASFDQGVQLQMEASRALAPGRFVLFDEPLQFSMADGDDSGSSEDDDHDHDHGYASHGSNDTQGSRATRDKRGEDRSGSGGGARGDRSGVAKAAAAPADPRTYQVSVESAAAYHGFLHREAALAQSLVDFCCAEAPTSTSGGGGVTPAVNVVLCTHGASTAVAQACAQHGIQLVTHLAAAEALELQLRAGIPVLSRAAAGLVIAADAFITDTQREVAPTEGAARAAATTTTTTGTATAAAVVTKPGHGPLCAGAAIGPAARAQVRSAGGDCQQQRRNTHTPEGATRSSASYCYYDYSCSTAQATGATAAPALRLQRWHV